MIEVIVVLFLPKKIANICKLAELKTICVNKTKKSKINFFNENVHNNIIEHQFANICQVLFSFLHSFDRIKTYKTCDI